MASAPRNKRKSGRLGAVRLEAQTTAKQDSSEAYPTTGSRMTGCELGFQKLAHTGKAAGLQLSAQGSSCQQQQQQQQDLPAGPLDELLLGKGLDALSFVGRATLEWGKAGVDAANQALTKLDVAGDTWLHGWDSPSPSAQIAARHASPPQPSPSHRDKPAECTENPAWSPFDFRDDSASESAASPAAVRESSPADATDCSSKSPGVSGAYQDPTAAEHPRPQGVTEAQIRQVLKKQASALRSERRRSGAMLQELQGLRDCEQQACCQLKALLAANAELASRNAELECENSGLLELTELLADQLPARQSSPDEGHLPTSSPTSTSASPCGSHSPAVRGRGRHERSNSQPCLPCTAHGYVTPPGGGHAQQARCRLGMLQDAEAGQDGPELARSTRTQSAPPHLPRATYAEVLCGAAATADNRQVDFVDNVE